MVESILKTFVGLPRTFLESYLESIKGIQFAEKELYCKAFHGKYSLFFKAPFKYSLEFEFSSAATSELFKRSRVGELLPLTYQCN